MVEANRSKYKIGILKEVQYTLEEVQAHTNMDGQDNWLVVDGYVYDVTLWAKCHPEVLSASQLVGQRCI